MRRKLLPFVLGGALSIAAVVPAAAAPNNTSVTNALIGVTVQAALENVDILNNSLHDLVDVNVNDSLNNLLQNALQNADIDILNGVEVRIENVLNNLNVNVSDVNVEIIDGDVVVTLLGGTITNPTVDTITLI